MAPKYFRFLAAWFGCLAMSPSLAHAAEPEKVTFPSGIEKPAELSGLFYRPAGPGPFPAIIALHGCGGIFDAKGEVTKRHADWADRWVRQGYAVLFPDSFGPRGLGSVCALKERGIRPRERAEDAAAAARYLANHSPIDSSKIALVGWSNGGSTVLWAVRQGFSLGVVELVSAIAFYPGCRPLAERRTWEPRLPLTILIGDADDWTPAAPCRVLAAGKRVKLIEYPGAVHDFDAPESRRRTRYGLAFTRDGLGRAEVGTDPAARAAAISEVTATLKTAFGK